MSSVKSAFLWTAFIVTGMLITGAINTVVKKLQNNWTAPGLNPRPHKFEHPWFQTFVMFIGEFLCVLGVIYERCIKKREEVDKLGEVKKEAKVFSWIFVLPTLCDIIGSSVAGIGLLWVSASIWQMMRGSIIIFSGILSIIFLKKKLEKHHWVGMSVVVLGLAVVGISGFLAERKSSTNNNGGLVIIGIVLILIGQMANAIHMIMEEIFIKKGNYTPLNIVAMEGLFGIVIMAVAVLPFCFFLAGSDSGSYENVFDALYQIKNSAGLLILNLVFLLSIAFYNYFGLVVAKELSTIHRTLIDALRTILVWLTSLVIYYAGAKSLGEPWQGGYSILQLFGLVLLMVGTALYNGSYQVVVNFFKKKFSKNEKNEEDLQTPLLSDNNEP